METAIVVGLGLNGLGVIRSLAQEKIPTIVLCENRSDPKTRTRYGRRLALSNFSGDTLEEKLEQLRTQFSEDPLLFLTQEHSVLELARKTPSALHGYKLCFSCSSSLDSFLNKGELMALAQAAKIPIPAGCRIQGEGDLANIKGLSYPCVFKPSYHNPIYDKQFSKAYQVADAGELKSIYSEVRSYHSDFIVQEWIDGEDSDIYFCLLYIGDNGQPVASVSGRKIRSWPPKVGGTASCVTDWSVNDELTELSTRLLNQGGYTGMAGVEFKRSRQSGQFILIEPTVGRTDYQSELATLSGVNLPAIAYAQITDPLNAQKPIEQRRTVIWRDSISDRKSRAQQNDKKLQDTPNLKGIRVYDAYFRISDPGPWLALTAGRVSRKLNRLIGKN